MNKKYTKFVLLTLVFTFSLYFPIIPYVKGDQDDILDWSVDHIDAERVWGGYDGATDISQDLPAGRGVKILHIDTGIEFDRDFNYDPIDDYYREGYDYIDGGDPDDTTGHGTATAGVIWMPDDGFGFIGVAPEAVQYVARVGANNPDLRAVKNAIYWGIQKEVDIITMSIAATGLNYKIDVALACIAAYNAGIILIAASGNNNEQFVYWPASFDQVIAVGAINKSYHRWIEVRDDETLGSNYGSNLELVAPGVDVRSVLLDGAWKKYTGTSMAAPFVAGVCALLLEMDPSLTPGEVRSILHNSALDLGEPGWDEFYGYGMVNACQAVDNEPPEVTITSPSMGDWVKGVVSITASATDNILVKKVAFKIDDGEWHYDTDGTDGWSYDWDSTGYTTGGHNIWVRAYDPRGLYDEDVVIVGVDNVPPSVDIINPSHSATVSGTITVTASASDDTEVEKVQFFIDSVLKYEDTNGGNGWTWNWDTLTSSEDNYHYVKVRAFDLAGNYADHQHTVFVNNFQVTPVLDVQSYLYLMVQTISLKDC